MILKDAYLRVASAFKACMTKFSADFPTNFVRDEQDKILRGFNLKHGDSELMSLLEETAPPVELARVALFRVPLQKYHKKVEEQKLQAEQAMAEKLAVINFSQTEQKVESDITRLEEWLCNATEFYARQAGMDLRYLATRCAHGKARVEKLQQEKHRYVRLSSFGDVVSDLLRFQGQRGVASPHTILMVDCTVFPTRGTLVDDALDVCKNISATNGNAVAFVTLPVAHSGNEKAQVVKNRRNIEDKIMSSMELIEVSLNSTDSGHAGDRRRRSQACVAAVDCSVHKSWGFSKSKPLMGTMQIQRARVNELVGHDPDQPVGPAHRAQQRGVPGTKELLQKLLEGLDLQPDAVIYLVDLVANRFNEFGRAAWELQRSMLQSGKGHDWHYVCYVNEEDDFALADEVDRSQNQIAGQMHTDWWDKSDEAGPPSRPGASFEQAIPDLEVVATDPDVGIKLPDGLAGTMDAMSQANFGKLKDRLRTWNTAKGSALKNALGGKPSASQLPQTSRAGTGPAGSPNRGQTRTQCQPIYTSDDFLPLCSQPWKPSTITISELQSQKVIKAQCLATGGREGITVIATEDHELWLANEQKSFVSCGPIELFGFGVGAYSQKPLGVAKGGQKDCLPWLLQKDTDGMVLVSEEGKKFTWLSELTCAFAQRAGLTEISVTDHDVIKRLSEDGTPVPFRYDIKASPKINTFEPRPLPESTDAMSLRPTLFGAWCVGNFDRLPQSQRARTVYEVTTEHTVLRPIKPKYWLTCALTLDAGEAKKIE